MLEPTAADAHLTFALTHAHTQERTSRTGQSLRHAVLRTSSCEVQVALLFARLQYVPHGL